MTFLIWAVPLSLVGIAVLLARRMLTVIVVRGDSMKPALSPGDRVLIRRCGPRPLRAGSLVVFQRPRFQADGDWDAAPRGTAGGAGGRWLIKRVAAVSGDAVPDVVRSRSGDFCIVPDGMVVALGDNPDHSWDSRHWGFVPEHQVLGHVICTLPGRPKQEQEEWPKVARLIIPGREPVIKLIQGPQDGDQAESAGAGAPHRLGPARAAGEGSGGSAGRGPGRC